MVPEREAVQGDSELPVDYGHHHVVTDQPTEPVDIAEAQTLFEEL
jgi:hypothetical protein